MDQLLWADEDFRQQTASCYNANDMILDHTWQFSLIRRNDTTIMDSHYGVRTNKHESATELQWPSSIGIQITTYMQNCYL